MQIKNSTRHNRRRWWALDGRTKIRENKKLFAITGYS